MQVLRNNPLSQWRALRKTSGSGRGTSISSSASARSLASTSVTTFSASPMCPASLICVFDFHGAWQAILLPINTSRTDARGPQSGEPGDAQGQLMIDREPFIVLSQTDPRSFPDPSTGCRARYWYAFHSASCDNPQHRGPAGMLLGHAATPFRHPFPYTDPCIHQAGTPTRRRDPRYLPIKTRSTDERLRMAPLRSSRKRKASSDSGPAQSSARSSSLTISDVDGGAEEVPVQIIQLEKARHMVAKFRMNVLTGGVKCAITGKGES